MIEVRIPKGEAYILRWIKGEWRDRAGHVWKLAKDNFVSERHGKAFDHDWKVL